MSISVWSTPWPEQRICIEQSTGIVRETLLELTLDDARELLAKLKERFDQQVR